MHADLINNGSVAPSPCKNRQHLKPKSLESSANRGRDIERWSIGEKDRGARDGALEREREIERAFDSTLSVFVY